MLEHCLHTWLLKPDVQAHSLKVRLHQKLGFRTEPYHISLYHNLKRNGPFAPNEFRAQEWFHLAEKEQPCLCLCPESYSGRILDGDEVSTLLSACASALTHLNMDWPIFLPVSDGLRDAFRGVSIDALAGVIRYYESDSVHGGRVESHELLDTQVQLRLFRHLISRKRSAAEGPPLSFGTTLDGGASSTMNNIASSNSVCIQYSYALPEKCFRQGDNDYEYETASSRADSSQMEIVLGDWDHGAPWRPWAQFDDPIGALELDVIWQSSISTSPDISLQDPNVVRIAALSNVHERDDGYRGFALQAVDKRRKYLTLPIVYTYSSSADILSPGTNFSSALSSFLNSSRQYGDVAHSVGQMASEDWWLRLGSHVPKAVPDWVIQDAIRDVFNAPLLPVWPKDTQRSYVHEGDGIDTLEKVGLWIGKAAPLSSLTTRLGLHAMVLNNPRALSALWIQFVRELRFTYWEKLQRLPRMSDAPTSPDSSTCLLHQKLQQIDYCIGYAIHQTASTASDVTRSTLIEDGGVLLKDVQGCTMYKTHHPAQPICIPKTQDAPPLTEDQLTEQALALSAATEEERIRVSGSLLLSDMEAFKAANGDCSLADFILWHSPKDIDPTSRELSSRMVQNGNTWHQLWQKAQAIPASKQKPLFQPHKEGERALHYLETLSVKDLYSELFALGTSAAITILSQASCSTLLPTIKRHMDDLKSLLFKTGRQSFVQSLHDTENMVAAGHSLLQRLSASNASLVNDILTAALADDAAAAVALVDINPSLLKDFKFDESAPIAREWWYRLVAEGSEEGQKDYMMGVRALPYELRVSTVVSTSL